MEVFCDVCVEANLSNELETPKACWYCENCKESQCDKCITAHKKQKLSKEHQIIEIDDKMKEQLLSKQTTETDEFIILCDVCQENSESETPDIGLPEAIFHCINCNENQCGDCSKEHKRQRLSRDHEIVVLNDQLKENLAKMKKTIDLCDVCAANNDNGTTDITAATWFCVNCREKQCDQCSNEHKRQKLSKNHDIVPVNDEIRKKHLIEATSVNSTDQQTTAMCYQCMEINGKHSSATMYCTDCEENQCDKCSEGHKRQKPCKNHQIVSITERLNQLSKISEEAGNGVNRSNPNKTQGDHANSKSDATLIQQTSRQRYAQINKDTVQKLAPLLKDRRYSKIQHLVDIPSINQENLEDFWTTALPYIIQRIKMWNGDVLSAQNLDSLITRKQNLKSTGNDHKQSGANQKPSCLNPVSRLDCLTYIINAADFIVAQDILRVLSKFPVAIPLIVQDIDDIDKYIATVPLLQNMVIKWESIPGQIVENHLFTSPFRMVVAVRLGNNKIGKSTILNQLMKKQFMFSSGSEAGSRYGRPRTLDGSVEISWLTQETCNDTTWKTILMKYYAGNIEEVAILANLHGDAIKYEDTLRFLLGLSCSFIVFLMPGFSHSQLMQLKQLLRDKITVPVLVDPEETSDDEFVLSTIQTAMLSTNDTQETMRCLLREALGLGFNLKHSFSKLSIDPDKSLRSAETLKCENAEKIVEIVRQHGCLLIREQLKRICSEEQFELNQDLKCLIESFIAVINSPRQCAKQSLNYLETHLSHLSGTESISIRQEVSEAYEKVRRRTNPVRNASEPNCSQELKDAQVALKIAMDKADNLNLGQEHFFRVLGYLYEMSYDRKDLRKLFPISEFPSYFADLLINGHAIELLNGDSGEMQLIWMKSICEYVSRKLSNLKVFVITIIGLQSSGKSTLLNALFSCKFAVSVGRCSRGLFMRLILLNNNLRKAYGCDGIILIDTEGLCSPEKLNDPKASQKDRLMTTYAMGVSDLTIVNILGEGMTEMTEILQIAIVAMARLRGGGIKPDILMVQHMQERNVSRIDQAKSQFCEAINKAFELISKNDVEIGSASAECLAELTERIQSGDLFQHFGPFRDGSSVNSPPSETYHQDIVSLFSTLFKRIGTSDKKKTFERWSHHFESYWPCVKEENFALNFKNVKHITDFLYFEKRIAKVRELLERAIRTHRDMFSLQISEEISVHITEKGKMEMQDMHRKILETKQQLLEMIPHACFRSCGVCREYVNQCDILSQEISETEWGEETKHFFKKQNDRLHESAAIMLQQTFDGSVVRQGCFSEFSEIITEELQKALDERPAGIYSPEEQQMKAQYIWNLLQNIAKCKQTIPDLDARIHQALNQEYVVTGVFKDIHAEFKSEIVSDTLFQLQAVKFRCVLGKPVSLLPYLIPLSEEQKCALLSTVDSLITTIFKSSGGDDFQMTGINFEEGMVTQIRIAFPEAIKKFENRFSIFLQDYFKIKLQIFALQQFRKEMSRLQRLWNKKNVPIEILMEKKADYLTKIETRLRSGFSSAGEGEIVAKQLLRALRKTSTQVAYSSNLDALKSLEWTTNSEKVRLLYFEELAKEVESGNKYRALKHFENPKGAIEQWYTKKVNSFRPRRELMKIYETTYAAELECVQQKVNSSVCKSDIDKILQRHIRNVEDQYFSQFDLKDGDFNAFKSSIFHNLGLHSKEQINEMIIFPLVSTDPEIKARLGCTEHCYWCGALCWGARDHQMEKERNPDMECHHSCHQPAGLAGLSYRGSRLLSSVQCHNRDDKILVWFKEFQEYEAGMLWSEAKQNHFPDWKFDIHCITKFDELMRWFFQELHQDIARQRGLLPADRNELRQNKCLHLKLDGILKVVHRKI